MITQPRPERRARTVALVGLVFQLALACFFALLAVWSGSEAMRALTLLGSVGITIWLFLVLIYHQRALVQDEVFETEQLRKEQEAGGAGETIFDVADEQLLLARRRLNWMYRWLLPVFTLTVIAELLVAGLAFWSWPLRELVSAQAWKAVKNSELLIWFVGGSAFLSFLFSRYATGMARRPEWRMLRAGASYLMGVTLASVALAATLGALHFFQSSTPERVLAYALRILLVVLAGETSLNFILDFYRPRGPEEEPRPAFDSRLLGLFTEPGGIARSIAEAINYQFGFEVSSTWFYKLLQRSVVPLIGFAIFTLFAASCIVFVGADEEAVLERFGVKQGDVLGPGLHLTYPWPIDIAYKVATARIHDLGIGIREEPEPGVDLEKELLLWTNKHSQEPHLQVLVATPKLVEFLSPAEEKLQSGVDSERAVDELQREEGGFAESGEAVAVSQLRVSVIIQYKILDAYHWLRHYENPEGMLGAIAEREIMRQCASVDVENLLGIQRQVVAQALWDLIQKSADEKGLGIKIEFLALQGVHPPVETANAFQEVIGAEQKKTTSIRSAWLDYNKRLTEVAGEVSRAEKLAKAIEKMHNLEDDKNASPADRKAARDAVATLFLGDKEKGIHAVGGIASERIVQARAKRWKLENLEHARAQRYIQEIAIKDMAPKLFYLRKQLEVLVAAPAKIRKYVIAAEGDCDVRSFQLNLQDAMSTPLDVTLEGEK